MIIRRKNPIVMSILAVQVCFCLFGFAGCVRAGQVLRYEPQALPAKSRLSIKDHKVRAYMLADVRWFNWGSSVIRARDGKYHMFYARWPRKDSFTAWLCFSEIAHAVADRPEGPYRFVGVAIASRRSKGKWFDAHNPKIKCFNGKYYLYFISTNTGDKKLSDKELLNVARKGFSHPDWMLLRNNQRSFVAVSDSLNGPWKITDKPIVEPSGPITHITVNPAVCRGPKGKYFMIVKGDKPGSRQRNQALAVSDSPVGPWVIQPRPAIDYMDTEDCSMWYDYTAKRFFATFHAHTYVGLISSKDGYNWQRAKYPRLSEKVVRFSDGSSWKPQRMERPFVLTDDRGRPQMLFVACKRGNDSLNIAIPLKAVGQ